MKIYKENVHQLTDKGIKGLIKRELERVLERWLRLNIEFQGATLRQILRDGFKENFRV